MSFKDNDGVPSGFIATNPFGVWGDAGSPGGNGLIGSSSRSSAVAGFTSANDNQSAGVFGMGPRVGVAGLVVGAVTAPPTKCGVYGSAAIGGDEVAIGVFGQGLSSPGVFGTSNTGNGVSGESVFGTGVWGNSRESAGVTGVGKIVGVNAFGHTVGVRGSCPVGALAGQFVGDVEVTGKLLKGGGGFRIDHPLDPENRYLSHSFVESPEMKNFYDGIAVCDESGGAAVELPEWFAALNESFRYQLTPIGASAPDLHIAGEVSGNRFRIGGGRPGTRVSWQVTGVRCDRWANANRIVVDAEKEQDARGRYLHAAAWGQPSERAIGAEYQKAPDGQ